MKQHNNAPSSTERFVQAQYIKEDGTIEIYPGYMVSNHGRVCSLFNTRGNKRKVMKILKPGVYGKHGHLFVSLAFNGKQTSKKVHRLILSSFCPELWSKDTNEVDHKDRNPENNFLSNLHWVSHNSNCANRMLNPLKKIKVTYLDDGHFELFDNMSDCSKAFGKSLNWCFMVISQSKGFNKEYNILIEKIDTDCTESFV